MVNSAREILGFNRIIELIAEGAVSEIGAARIGTIEPFLPRDEALQRMEQIATLQRLREDKNPFPLLQFDNIELELKRCRVEGAYLLPETLFQILKIQRQILDIQKFFRQNRASLKPLIELLDNLKPLESQVTRIHRIIDEDESIKDSASPDLGRIRKQMQQTVARLQREVDRVMHEAQQEGWLHEENPTIRDGRFVLPLRSESKRKIKGIIHGQSATGATAYVEPLIIVEINNSLKELEIEEQAEIRRILIRVTAELRPDFVLLSQNIDMLAKLDFLNACSKFAFRFECRVPRISADQGGIVLKNARHPLLSLVKKVIPLNVAVAENIHCVIITGPNAGGKTVAMKTIGLLSMMVMYGLPVPVDAGSVIPFFDRILVDIGDQQSIEDDLSTFTSHVSNLKRFTENATSHSLVLIDELGTGTDPLEGSALGQSVLEELVSRRTFTVVTTHHSGLKAFADKGPNIMNAAMEFDTDQLQPTYRFQLGLPGSSYALEISKRLGLSVKIIDRARELMGTDQVKLENLLLEVETLKTRIEEENQSVARNKITLDKLITEYELKMASIREKHESMDSKIAEELERIVNESRSKIEHAVKDIREKDASRATIIEAKKTLNALQQTAQDRLKKRKPLRKISSNENFEIDDLVKVSGISGSGQIVEFQSGKKRAAVNISGKLIWVSVSSLQRISPTEDHDAKTAEYAVRIENVQSSRLDLRGKRYDEARDELERFLDRALLAGLNQVQIIHGMGTGALQKMTHEVLKNTRGIRKFYFENFDQGGTGATIAEL